LLEYDDLGDVALDADADVKMQNLRGGIPRGLRA
jgi:hypothetical protein